MSTAALRQVLAAPVQLAPKVVRPKSSTVRAIAQPLADLAEDILGRHGHVVKRQPGRGGAADAALGHARFDHLEAGHVGRDQEGRDLRSRCEPGTGVRAMTVSTWAMPPLVM